MKKELKLKTLLNKKVASVLGLKVWFQDPVSNRWRSGLIAGVALDSVIVKVRKGDNMVVEDGLLYIESSK